MRTHPAQITCSVSMVFSSSRQYSSLPRGTREHSVYTKHIVVGFPGKFSLPSQTGDDQKRAGIQRGMYSNPEYTLCVCNKIIDSLMWNSIVQKERALHSEEGIPRSHRLIQPFITCNQLTYRLYRDTVKLTASNVILLGLHLT